MAQGSAKEWSLGCVNVTLRLPLAEGCEFTQPRVHSSAEPCSSVFRACASYTDMINQFLGLSRPINMAYQRGILRLRSLHDTKNAAPSPRYIILGGKCKIRLSRSALSLRYASGIFKISCALYLSGRERGVHTCECDRRPYVELVQLGLPRRTPQFRDTFVSNS